MHATTTSRVRLEAVTPRIDSEQPCRCTATIIWDEVFGWLHALPAHACRTPEPAEGWSSAP